MSCSRTDYNTAFLIKINMTSAIMSMHLIKTPTKSIGLSLKDDFKIQIELLTSKLSILLTNEVLYSVDSTMKTIVQN